MTDATAWDPTEHGTRHLVDLWGTGPGPRRPRNPFAGWSRRARTVAACVLIAAPVVGYSAGNLTALASPDGPTPPTPVAATDTTSSTNEHNPTAPRTATPLVGTSTSTTGEVTATTTSEPTPPEPVVPTSPTTVLEPTTTEAPVETTVPVTVREPVVDWMCVGDATWGQGPTYNLAMWQVYGGTGLPEDHVVLWPEVAQSMYTNEGIDPPQDCVT